LEGGMSDGDGPWSFPPPRRAATPRRAWIWLAMALLAAAWIVGLFVLFPGRITTDEDWTRLMYGIGVLVLVSAGLFASRRLKLVTVVRYAAIWMVIIGVLVAAVAYHNEVGEVALRVLHWRF
jgi:hypothetical protein